jgi:hypothetical protein
MSMVGPMRSGVLLVLVGAACGHSGSSTGPPATQSGPLSGRWVGGSSPPVSLTVQETLTSRSVVGGVSGSGMVGTTPVAVSGTDSVGHVALTLALTGFRPAFLTGTLVDTMLTAALDSSGFNHLPIVLYKQR